MAAAGSHPGLPAETGDRPVGGACLIPGALAVPQASRLGEMSRGMTGKAGRTRSPSKLKRMMSGASGRKAVWADRCRRGLSSSVVAQLVRMSPNIRTNAVLGTGVRHKMLSF